MRSRVLSMKDPRSVDLSAISSCLEPFVLDQERLDRELARLTNPYIRWEKGSKAAKGDIAVCQLISDCPRFNRERVQFVVGSGMFHQELEALTAGMSVGETRQSTLPEGCVSVTLTEAMNRIVPPLSDEMVEPLGLKDVHTIEGYTAYLIRQQKAQWIRSEIYHPQQYIIQTVIRDSEFVLHQEDWQWLVDTRLERTRLLLRQEGLVLEEMDAAQLQRRMPVSSYYELVSQEQQYAWQSLCLHLLGRYLAEQDGFCVPKEEYEHYIKTYMERAHVSEVEAREVETYAFYEFYMYGVHATEYLTDSIVQRLTEE